MLIFHKVIVLIRLSHLPHLFVVVVSEVQFVSGLWLRLPWVDVIWIWGGWKVVKAIIGLKVLKSKIKFHYS